MLNPPTHPLDPPPTTRLSRNPSSAAQYPRHKPSSRKSNPRENGTTVTFNNYAIGFFRRSKDADELLIQHIATSLGTLPRGSCGCPSRHAPRKVASDTPSRRAAFCRLRLRAGKVGSSIWYDQCACPPERRDQPSSGLCAPDRTGLSSRSSYQNGPRQGSHRYRHPSICVVQLCAI